MNSTSGEIIDTQAIDETISLTAVKFEKTQFKTGTVNISSFSDSYEAGRALAAQLDPNNLKNVFVISDGQLVNGSDLVTGLQSIFPKDTIIAGGLAVDGAHFQTTLVGLNDNPKEGMIVAIGFYGFLTVTYGSVGDGIHLALKD